MRDIKFKYIYKKDNKTRSYIFTLQDIEYLDDVIEGNINEFK